MNYDKNSIKLRTVLKLASNDVYVTTNDGHFRWNYEPKNVAIIPVQFHL